MYSWVFWRQVLERAVKSAAQALIGLWALDGFNILHADLTLALGTVLGAAALSVLTSIVSLPVSQPESPSLVPTTAGSTSTTTARRSTSRRKDN